MSKTKSTGNEKAKGTVRQQLWMAPLVLTVICLVTAALLGFTYQYTKPIIDESLRQQANHPYWADTVSHARPGWAAALPARAGGRAGLTPCSIPAAPTGEAALSRRYQPPTERP